MREGERERDFPFTDFLLKHLQQSVLGQTEARRGAKNQEAKLSTATAHGVQ